MSAPTDLEELPQQIDDLTSKVEENHQEIELLRHMISNLINLHVSTYHFNQV